MDATCFQVTWYLYVLIVVLEFKEECYRQKPDRVRVTNYFLCFPCNSDEMTWPSCALSILFPVQRRWFFCIFAHFPPCLPSDRDVLFFLFCLQRLWQSEIPSLAVPHLHNPTEIYTIHQTCTYTSGYRTMCGKLPQMTKVLTKVLHTIGHWIGHRREMLLSCTAGSSLCNLENTLNPRRTLKHTVPCCIHPRSPQKHGFITHLFLILSFPILSYKKTVPISTLFPRHSSSLRGLPVFLLFLDLFDDLPLFFLWSSDVISLFCLFLSEYPWCFLTLLSLLVPFILSAVVTAEHAFKRFGVSPIPKCLLCCASFLFQNALIIFWPPPFQSYLDLFSSPMFWLCPLSFSFPSQLGSTSPCLVSASFSNENSICLFPLWLSSGI